MTKNLLQKTINALAPVIDFEYPDPARVLGLSTSHWTGIVDWQKAKANGIKFAIIKAGNGTNMKIPLFKENYLGAKDAGILVGAYTWLFPSRIYSAGRQARLFAELLKDYPLDIPACVDFEWTYVNPNSGDLWGFVFPFEAEYGKKPMIYTAPGYWNQFGSPKTLWADYPLWQAQYNHGASSAIKPWTGWDFLQWTEKGRGIDYGVPVSGERACELNYWRGTEAELFEYCGKTPPEPTPLMTVTVTPVGGYTEIIQNVKSMSMTMVDNSERTIP